MANRFSTVGEYQSLVRAHAVIGALVFLGIVPAAVMTARFYTRTPGAARHFHAMLNGFTILLLTPAFILGWFAVGPNRSWTNPHHAIGLAIYVMFLLQLIGGRIVRNIPAFKPSLRLTFHQWSGRLIALLGIIQVPLGLTLYGSPKYLFILFSIWMAFLLLLYFILDFRAKSYRNDIYASGAAPGGPVGTQSEYHTEYTEHADKRTGWKRWLGPLLAIGGIWALLRRRKNNKEALTSRSRSRSRSPRRGPEVIPSRRGSASYIQEEKYTDIDSRRDDGNKTGGFMKGLLGVGAALGAGKLVSGMANRRRENRYQDEYSAVSTETPRRDRVGRRPGAVSEYSDYTVDTRRPGAESLLPPPGHNVAAAQALSASEERPVHRPMEPRPSHARTQSGYGMEPSDYSSYVSPSRRPAEAQGSGRAGMGTGLLAGLGLGWLGKKWSDRKKRQAEDRRLREEEDLRSGMLSSRYTGDGYSTPSRRETRRPGRVQASTIGTSMTGYTEDSSRLEPHQATSGFSGPPMPPLQAGAPPPPGGYANMPPMPPDSQGGIQRDYASDAYTSPSGVPARRASSRRRRAGERAAAAAAASAAGLAAEQEAYRDPSRRGEPVAVKVRVHDDKDRNVTLRRLTEEEAAASRREQARRRNDSVGSLSGTDSPSRRRYRRDTSQRRAEMGAESAVSGGTLPPPNPAFAAGRKPKDSAYYSGQPAPTGTPVNPAEISSVGSPESHGTWSGMSPAPSGAVNQPAASAADNRRRRRLERRRSTSRPTGTDMFD